MSDQLRLDPPATPEQIDHSRNEDLVGHRLETNIEFHADVIARMFPDLASCPRSADQPGFPRARPSPVIRRPHRSCAPSARDHRVSGDRRRRGAQDPSSEIVVRIVARANSEQSNRLPLRSLSDADAGAFNPDQGSQRRWDRCGQLALSTAVPVDAPVVHKGVPGGPRRRAPRRPEHTDPRGRAGHPLAAAPPAPCGRVARIVWRGGRCGPRGPGAAGGPRGAGDLGGPRGPASSGCRGARRLGPPCGQLAR
jgi:hypothetical protein